MSSDLSAWKGPLSVDDPSAVQALRDALVAAKFDEESVRAALDAGGDLLVRAGEEPLLQRRLRGKGPLGTIIGLFILDLPLPIGEVNRALKPFGVDHLEKLGLVETGAGQAWTTVRLVPHGSLLLVSDRSGAGRDYLPEHVAGVHPASVTLANLTVRRPVETALDIGTGSGVQAIYASRHCQRVVATDLSERALNFTAFNALLNGAGNLELRQGSFFEPVAGEQFDLLACNPPFVISPDTAYLFRDSGLDGDTVSRNLVQTAPGSLTEGGFATMLVSWTHPPTEEWSSKLREWLAGSGCDALLLHYGTEDPLSHIGNWTFDRYGPDPVEFDAVITRWLDYLNRLGIEGVAYGGVVLRRREAGPNWVLEYELPPPSHGPAGEQIGRVFETQDYLRSIANEDVLLDTRFRVAEAARVEQRVVLRDTRWIAEAVTIKLSGGLGFDAAIDPPTAQFLAALDGERTLAEVTAAIAERKKQDPTATAHASLPVIRGMLELGFVVPVR